MVLPLILSYYSHIRIQFSRIIEVHLFYPRLWLSRSNPLLFPGLHTEPVRKISRAILGMPFPPFMASFIPSLLSINCPFWAPIKNFVEKNYYSVNHY
jgi:hypothetical protein